MLTCETIATERAAIAATLQQPNPPPGLVRRDAELARLAALKRCPAER